MADGTLTVSGQVAGLLTGSKTVGPITLSTTSPDPQTITVELASGANTITVPTGASGVLVVFAPASTTDKTLKGVTGDTGIQVADNSFVALTFDSPAPASFVITSSAADTGNVTEILFI